MNKQNTYYFAKKTIISNENFHRVDFINKHMKNVIFNQCDFRGAFFNESLFEDCEFNGCSLITLQIIDCEFIDCSFTDCRAFAAILANVAFSKCKLLDVNLRLSSLESVNITNSLMNCLNLNEEVIFDKVSYDNDVIWPDDFSPQQHGLILIK